MDLIIRSYDELIDTKKIFVKKNRIDAFVGMVKMNMYANEKKVIENVSNGNVLNRWCLR